MKKNKVCCQNTGFGWWNKGETAETVRTNVGGGGLIANLVVEISHDERQQQGRTDLLSPGANDKD